LKAGVYRIALFVKISNIVCQTPNIEQPLIRHSSFVIGCSIFKRDLSAFPLTRCLSRPGHIWGGFL